MNLHKLILTKNPCYIAGRKIKPKGIMVHSTGANNPWLHRYVGPDDGKLGLNRYDNHWNQDTGRAVCVHAFIGKLADGSIATYQTLPWDHRGWHAGGSANNTHIGFEICEDHLADSGYFAKVYQEAVELCAYLCKEYDLTEKDIIDHSEGHKQGIASNHGDVGHWFPRHGKSMGTFRSDVRALLGTQAPESKPTPSPAPKKKSITELAKEVIDGKWGNGAERKEKLTAAGYDATKVQAEVNELLKGETPKTSAPKKKSITTIAKEVIDGKWGNGAERKEKLTVAGYDATAVQAKVNELLSPKPAKKSNTEIAQEVIDGKWGNGAERKEKLKAAGYDATAIQKLVNKMLG